MEKFQVELNNGKPVANTLLFLLLYFRGLQVYVINFVCSHASQEYARIFLDREPIRAREKHYSLVWYMLMKYILHVDILH